MFEAFCGEDVGSEDAGEQDFFGRFAFFFDNLVDFEAFACGKGDHALCDGQFGGLVEAESCVELGCAGRYEKGKDKEEEGECVEAR